MVRYPFTVAVPSTFEYLTQTTKYIRLLYPADGAVITAYQLDVDDEVVPIARGVVEEGSAVLPYFNEPDPKYPIHYAAALPGSVAKPVTP